ncbi:hypothetical protein M758_10G063700 [Ceratodon purpureus]|nr:hypothetical protein M758_10G063700 [Ceratodon purpureus]
MGKRENLRESGGRPGPSDPNLLKRMEEFGREHGLKDMDAALEYLQNKYPEYKRKQAVPFRKYITLQVPEVQRRIDAQKEKEREKAEKEKAERERERAEKEAPRSRAEEEEDRLREREDAHVMDMNGVGDMNEDLAFDVESPREAAPVAMEEEQERPAFAPPHVIAERVRAQAMRAAKSPAKSPAKSVHPEPAAAEERGSPPAQSSGRPPQPVKASSQFQGSVVQQDNGRPYLPLATPFSRTEKSKQVEEKGKQNEDRESTVVLHEGKIIRKRERESEKARSGGKKGKWVHEKGEREAPDREAPASSAAAAPRNVSFKDLGGIEGILGMIRELIEYPLVHPDLYDWLGVQPPRGVLLHGPPGCGKTMLANAIAVETGVPFLKISAPEVVSGMSGESEAKVRSLFAEAVKVAPCIVFIDEIDAITPKRETAQREMERRIVAQLLTCMDDLSQPLADVDPKSEGRTRQRPGHVIVIGATNRPDALDPALRRAGRFDREIALGIPDENARARILSVLSRKLRLEGSFDFKRIARRTPGFVGADLAALSKEAAALAVKRIFSSKETRTLLTASADPKSASIPNGEEYSAYGGSRIIPDYNKNLMNGADVDEDLSTQACVRGDPYSPMDRIESASVCGEVTKDADEDDEKWREPWSREELEQLAITMQDFEDAVEKVQPSAKREGFATIPGVTWEDVGSLGDVREDLEFSICRAIKFPEEYQALGIDMATGVLLYGPPGCGKTLVAKAVANEAGANFISVKGPELLNKYVGESERAVRQLFTRARASSPCILFFDEMDAMAPRRGSDGNGAAERVVNQLLTEMDGLEQRKSIFLIAATNRPDMIDPALLRPGRLDTLLYVPLPDAPGRASIMRTLVRSVPISPDVDVGAIGARPQCEGFSGADLASLVREACTAALKDRIRMANGADNMSHGVDTKSERLCVTSRHFEIALTRVFPSVSNTDRKRYEALRQKLRRSRGHLQKPEGEIDLIPSDVDVKGNEHLAPQS